MTKVLNLIGKRFGELVVINRVENCKTGKSRWLCKCDCGNETIVNVSSLNSGDTKSCGCRKIKNGKEIGKTVGISNLFKANKKYMFKDTKITCINNTLPKNNTSGFKGVTWSKRKSKWIAQIGVRKKNVILGEFKKIEDAIKARKEAEEKYFKPIIEEYNNLKTESEDNK